VGRQQHICHEPGQPLWHSFGARSRRDPDHEYPLTLDDLYSSLPGRGIPCVYALFEDYSLVSERMLIRPAYVGQSVDVCSRLFGHYKKLPNWWRGSLSLALACIIPCRSTAEMNAMEAAEIARLRPMLNKQGLTSPHPYTVACERAQARRDRFRVISSEVSR
jgi:hypothetical protein